MEQDVIAVSTSMHSFFHVITAYQWNKEYWTENDEKNNTNNYLGHSNVFCVSSGSNAIALVAVDISYG
tara:strand:- start:352 stop:555 length:204 start_codon:yes stop_codon:yes gene_type:complete